MDMDIDDLLSSGRPSQPTARTGRFQPKPKSKPETLKPKPEPPIETLPPAKKEESDAPGHLLSTGNITKAAVEDEEMATEPNLGGDNSLLNEEEDKEDTVVREIDVFFDPTPLGGDGQLYILQYPCRPCWRPYEINERCQEVRVKPAELKLEIDVETIIDNENYNEEAAERLKLQKWTLSSSAAPLVTDYAVGFLSGNKLHLKPVHAVVKLRRSMGYLDVGQAQKDNVTGNEVTASPDTPWVSFDYHGMDSPISNNYRQSILVEESSHIQFEMSSLDYLDSLCQRTLSDKNRPKGPSKRLLLTLPLEERMKKWFSEGPEVNRFDALMHLAPDDSKDDVLKLLQLHADLVQGLWVAKSSLRCDDTLQSLVRDYILLLFSKNRYIHNDQLKVLRVVPNKVVMQALTPLAAERSGFQDWKFKETEDLLFIKAHPDIVEKQRQAWSSREINIIKVIHGIGRRNAPAMPRSSSQISDQGVKGRTSLDRANQGPKAGGPDGAQSSGTTTMSAETREALPKALLELFSTHKVCSLQLICQGLRDMAISKSTLPKADARARAARAAALGVSSLPELQAIMSQITVNIHGVYVLKSSPDNPDINPLRSVVIDLFCGKEPNAKLKKADIVHSAKIKLNRDISNSEYNQVVNELCVSCKGGAWMLKSGDGKPR